MPNDTYPITVYEIPSPEELADLWQDGLEALAKAIAESVRRDLQFAREGDIIEMPAVVSEEGVDEVL